MMDQQASATNVVSLRQGFLPRHREYLMRWLQAGACMGLCDADITNRDENDEVDMDHVLVWVRENANPAYMVRPEGMGGVLIDQIRERPLATYRSFEAALHAIRPVLSCGATVAA
ncbi:hypothetical protein LV478_15815 [Komagataeibacter oboediens]|uniref:hypothetical protein n=1 Tax=Komagataeibacter oboediens TaxID=65958 RepID=UPI0023DB3BFB|nr:hypothetical protein [Komagataeibacter oboediens]WEQ51946.1 hypothetical protein LV478_15815 [Komagataeibacter oboediens]